MSKRKTRKSTSLYGPVTVRYQLNGRHKMSLLWKRVLSLMLMPFPRQFLGRFILLSFFFHFSSEWILPFFSFCTMTLFFKMVETKINAWRFEEMRYSSHSLEWNTYSNFDFENLLLIERRSHRFLRFAHRLISLWMKRIVGKPKLKKKLKNLYWKWFEKFVFVN